MRDQYEDQRIAVHEAPPRSPAALALVGWYMMTPPLSANGEHRGGAKSHRFAHIRQL